MLAVIRLVVMLPGDTAPKLSWVILLSGPVGVMSVSPVARPATTTRYRHQHRQHAHPPRDGEDDRAGDDDDRPERHQPHHEPRARHLDALERVVRVARRAGDEVRDRAERAHDRLPLQEEQQQPEVTIIGTPIHRLHDEIRRSAEPPLLAMTPASMKYGARMA